MGSISQPRNLRINPGTPVCIADAELFIFHNRYYLNVHMTLGNPLLHWSKMISASFIMLLSQPLPVLFSIIFYFWLQAVSLVGSIYVEITFHGSKHYLIFRSCPSVDEKTRPAAALLFISGILEFHLENETFCIIPQGRL